jgi:hypothetical protein
LCLLLLKPIACRLPSDDTKPVGQIRWPGLNMSVTGGPLSGAGTKLSTLHRCDAGGGTNGSGKC